MFGQNSKVAILESKFDMYENLSREMMSKLEAAVDKISEGNQSIASILAKHDERIDQTLKTDVLIMEKIKEVKEENEKNSKILHERIDNIQDKKIGPLLKFSWGVGTVLVFSGVLLTLVSNFIPPLLTKAPQQVIIENPE